MEPGTLAWLGFGWWSLGTAVHWASAALARSPGPTATPRHQARDFSIVAPMAGAEDATPDYVQTLRALSQAGAEVLICVAQADDGAVAPLRALWPDAPVLVGNDTTFNPKMNNARKGFEAASREIVALCDAGIMLELEELRAIAAGLSDKVGLVLALKAGEGPHNFAAEIERAYIDGHQARFLFAADRLGIAVASGGVTLLTNATLQRIGNWRGFNRWIADDYSVVRSVRELGLATKLGAVMPRLPLNHRPWRTVWRRQVRWARTRLRLPVWPLVLWEPAIGWAATGFVGAVALACSGAGVVAILAALVGHTIAWVAAEKWFMSGRGLSFGVTAACAAMVREALAPFLIAGAFASRSIYWRGTDLGGQWRDRSSAEPGEVDMSNDGNRVSTVMLPTRIDSVTTNSVEAMMISALRPGAALIVDGSEVSYMSAAGVRTLATVLHRAEELRTKVVFCSFRGAAADCLVVSGFSELLDVAETVAEAEARLQNRGGDGVA